MSLLAVFAVLIMLTAAHAQSARRRSTSPPPDAPQMAVIPTVDDFSTKQVEHYIGNEGIAYILPGLQITVESVEIPSDRKPVVELYLKDNFGNPVDRLGMATPGSISVRFILSWLNPDNREYVPYTKRTATGAAGSFLQGSTDSGGTFTDLEVGHYMYKFGTTLPADYPASMTHTLGIYATRDINIPEFHIEKRYVDNVLESFVPAGGPVTVKWDKLATQSCNNCHDTLALHGGSRREVGLCVLCHAEGTGDPDSGNTVDFEVMIHKIHMGADLPSVQAGTPYQIIGFRGSVHDYSEIEFPQDKRNCKTCHYGQGNSPATTQSELWYTEPSTDACGACHDNVNFVTGEGHAAGPAENGTCTTCHQPDGAEFGPSIIGAHTIPEKSEQLEGLKFEIVDVSNVGPGMQPTVVFAITDNAGNAVNGADLDRFAPNYAGPTTDYTTLVRSGGETSFDTATGWTSFTFDEAMPDDASGTWAFSADVYRFVNITTPGDGDPIRVREAAYNNVAYKAITGNLMPRRQVVDIDNCNVCHNRLALHGGQRLNTEECIMCHNPTATDEDVRPADQLPAQTITFKFMIHRIHKGHELTRDFTVYGFRGSVHNYNELHFPGHINNCEKCHVNDSYIPPLPSTAAPVIALREFYSPLGATAGACLGCHDTRDAAAHAFLMTTDFGGTGQIAEACGVCHGEEADWSVERVHAE